MTKILQFLVVSFLLSVPWLSAAGKPNIVVFISDDLGRLDTSIHGSKDVRTPTMDRLAAGGMTFDNAYVASPSCCPSRFSFLTGLMPARHGAHPNHSQVKPGTKFLGTNCAFTITSLGNDFNSDAMNISEPAEIYNGILPTQSLETISLS